MKSAVIKFDFLQIRKDPMLLASITAPILFWILLRFGFPAAGRLFLSMWQVDIYPWFNHAGVFFIALVPMMFGMAYGFMLLDERDEGIITAISVTPMGKSGYLLLRMGMPVIFSFITIMIFCLTLDIAGNLRTMELVILALILSLSGPLLVLALGAFAKNKVMGVAISKGFGVILAALLIDYVVPGHFKWIGAYSPLFWIERAYFSISVSQFILYSVVAFSYSLVLIIWLNRIFAAKIN